MREEDIYIGMMARAKERVHDYILKQYKNGLLTSTEMEKALNGSAIVGVQQASRQVLNGNGDSIGWEPVQVYKLDGVPLSFAAKALEQVIEFTSVSDEDLELILNGGV